MLLFLFQVDVPVGLGFVSGWFRMCAGLVSGFCKRSLPFMYDVFHFFLPRFVQVLFRFGLKSSWGEHTIYCGLVEDIENVWMFL